MADHYITNATVLISGIAGQTAATFQETCAIEAWLFRYIFIDAAITPDYYNFLEPYAKLKIDFGWLNAAHPVDANDSQ